MRRLPEIINNVSQTQLSIARHYGVISFNGQYYVHDGANDRLIRADIYAQIVRAEKQAEQDARPDYGPAPDQGELI